MDELTAAVFDRPAGAGKRVLSALGFGIELDAADHDLPGLLRHLEYRARYIAMPVGLLGSAILTAFAWSASAAPLLAAWWAVLGAYLALRYGATSPERTVMRDPASAARVARRVAVGCGISGSLQGALAAIAFTQPEPAVHGLAAFVTGVVSALSIVSLHPVMKVWAAFNVTMVMPAAVACALADSVPPSMVAAAVLFLAGGGFAFVRTLHVGLRTRLAQQRRIEQLVSTVEDQARQDPLTGLRNRLWLGEHLAQSAGTQDTALVFIDLDGFKQLNDHHGHAAGDTVLRDFGRALAEHCRPTDLAARLGGDEFVILMAGMGSRAAADAVARRTVEAALAAVTLPRGRPGGLGASFGIGILAVGCRDADAALREADAAMYAAKRSRAAAPTASRRAR
jgi:diguanylate cyclase (GGDEF)-like protein